MSAGDASSFSGKGVEEKVEHAHHHTANELAHGDKALALSEQRVVVTEEDDRRIRRRTDLYILSFCCWIYFLQILDKSMLGFASIFGLKKDAHLVGNEYAQVGTIGYYAQLGAQPLGALLLVKIPPRIFMPVIVTLWGAALTGMAFSRNYHELLATRCLLGFFEAACLPLFSIITASWYRRNEQPMRVAAWYSTNGFSNILGSLLAYGLGHIHSSKLHSYQIIFLVTGLVTVISGPFAYYRLDNSVVEARFLTPEDRIKGVERLRANQTGISNSEFKWGQIGELLIEPKTIIFFLMAICINAGAAVTNVFGPLILQNLAGFSSYTTILLNLPFGTVQFIVIVASSWLAWKMSRKGVIFFAFIVPVVVGAAILYTVPHVKSNKGPLLFAYYCLAFLFAANPLIVSWMLANTAGHTKKAACMSAYNAASSVGNIIGPQLFKAKDAPNYIPGLKGVLVLFCVLLGLIVLQIFLLMGLNKRKEATRVKNGKPAKLEDLSMMNKFDNTADNSGLGEQAFLDLTDKENDEFIYIY